MILTGDAIEQLATRPERSVHCCVTSPPYWNLRDYGVDGQIGLEATPEEYIAKMVEVFRAVWRVLRDDGSLWLNIGDSYASGKAKENYVGAGGDDLGWSNQQSRAAPPGLKPKDLVGIPWMLAKALRDPFYTGTIKSELDRVWLACAIEAEGCLFIHKRKAGQSNGQGYTRKHDNYAPGLEVANTSLAFVERCKEITGLGSICTQSPAQNKRRKQTIYRWNLRTIECRDIIREVYPYFVTKQHQARLLLSCPSSGDKASEAHQSLMRLHNGLEASIDFPPPAAMFEQGWFLRSEIIWKKPNPMPESAKDRPTKSHEQMFLLTKRGWYFYDQDAIREPFTDNSIARAAQDLESQMGSRRAHGGTRPDRPMGMVGEASRGANKRTVWTIPTFAYPKAHFATFPPKLVEPCILAGTSAKGCCPECGAPWKRVVESERVATRPPLDNVNDPTGKANRDPERHVTESVTTGWTPTCECGGGPVPAVIVDPFAGSGTVGQVAREHGRDYLLVELNPEYVEQIKERLAMVQPPLLSAT